MNVTDANAAAALLDDVEAGILIKNQPLAELGRLSDQCRAAHKLAEASGAEHLVQRAYALGARLCRIVEHG
jgi:hypothetical protein